MRMLRDWGAEKKYHHVLKGYNYRMEGMQGAILRVKLRHLPAWTRGAAQSRRGVQKLLVEQRRADADRGAVLAHVYHVYAVRTTDRVTLQRTLQCAWRVDRHSLPDPGALAAGVCRPRTWRRRSFPESERAANEVLSLPMFPELTTTQIETVAAAVRQESFAA